MIGLTHRVDTDHTKHHQGMHFPVMDAMAHLTYQLTKQDFHYGTEWDLNGVDTNDKGQRVIEIVWHVERKAMIVTLSGVETIYGDHR